MPKMELLIKKVYSNIYNKSTKSLASKTVKNYALINNINKAYEFNEEVMHITAEKRSNHKIFHLYSNMTQTLLNFSNAVILQEVINGKIKFKADSGKSLSLIFWTKDAFGGVWSYL